MNRTLLTYLQDWLISSDRKPLVIRGARQVGKTWLVRHFAEKCKKILIELNFEKRPAYATLFNSNDPQQILLNLSTVINDVIDPQNAVLFLDEIQAVPELFGKLRWFAEEVPQLPVIAAGSLLEFVLESHSFSMPVGRVSYAHLEPLSFEEFLQANNKQSLYDYLLTYDLKMDVPEIIHEELTNLFKEYLLIGGMPAAVVNWAAERSLSKINQIQHDLLATYRDDFSKYKGRIEYARLDEVLIAVPKMLGKKFVYSHVNDSISSNTIKQVLDLLGRARVCHRVWSSSSNGVPLAAEIREKYFKEIFLDVGLCSASLGLGLNQINTVNEITMVNNGGIAEQVVGQLLRTIEAPYIEPALYYWQREEPGSNAEVDYLIQHGDKVVPIEVKAGKSGTLKSLHIFMGLKEYAVAVRVNSDLPNKTPVDIKNRSGNQVKYTLISIPFYLIGQIHRLIENKIQAG